MPYFPLSWVCNPILLGNKIGAFSNRRFENAPTKYDFPSCAYRISTDPSPPLMVT